MEMRRLPVLAGIGACALLTAGAMAWWSSPGPPPAPVARLAARPAAPYLLFVSVRTDDAFQHVASASLEHPNQGIYVSPLACRRVYFAGARGICLKAAAEGQTTRFEAVTFDADFRPGPTIPLTGDPSRVRVSPDGRRAAATVFESGHAYNEHGFSTRTTVIDLSSGKTEGDLEQFAVTNEGRPFTSEDFNFWGVTFARDSNRFYATLDTKGVSYLVEGDVDRRTMRVLKAGVECPSLSPDNTRLAFKKRIGSRTSGWWQLAMLELPSLRETILLGEKRSVDDQVEWLDDGHVMYHMSGRSTDVWVLPIDGSPARSFVTGGYSPAVVR
jgi:hypothetical protein